MARFDWIRFDPDGSTGGGGSGIVDDFDGTTLDGAWERIRGDQAAVVSGGTLQIPAQPGDIYQEPQRRQEPHRARRARRSLGGDHEAQLQGLRPVPAGRASWCTATTQNFTKFGRIATNASGSALTEKFEFINEVAGVARNAARGLHGEPGGGLPGRLLAALQSDGTNVTGQYSTDGGTNWITVGRPAALPGRTPRSACSPSPTTARATRSRPSTPSPSRVTRSAAAAVAAAARRRARATTTSSTATRSTRRAGTRSCATPRPSTRSAAAS